MPRAEVNRRNFLKSSALTAASVGLLPAFGADDADWPATGAGVSNAIASTTAGLPIEL